MAVTANYRRQHSDLADLIREISGKLDENALSGGGAAEVKEMLTRLAGKLLVHLAAEDQALYPKMIASADREISDTAKRFQDEMSGLKEAFQAYYAKWSRIEDIRNDPAGFAGETQGVFEALGNRVQQENSVLYELADRL